MRLETAKTEASAQLESLRVRTAAEYAELAQKSEAAVAMAQGERDKAMTDAREAAEQLARERSEKEAALSRYDAVISRVRASGSP